MCSIIEEPAALELTILSKMLFSLCVVFAFASICTASKFSVEPLHNLAAKQVSKEIGIRANKGLSYAYGAKRAPSLR